MKVLAIVLALCLPHAVLAKKTDKQDEAKAEDTSRLKAETFSGLELRSIGPALMSGRIADLAVDPRYQSTWYVAVGSGGVWKTTNAGTTWTPGSVASPSTPAIPTWSGWAPARMSAAATSATATVSTRASTAARRGRRWGSRSPSTSA
ncbi:MAG: hypothetical protein V3T72_07180 [Thermoanaerobaculia bacterium]